MLITFEGLDASGKSTQAQAICERLKEIKKDVLLVREPGGTILGERIRNLLLDTKNNISSVSEVFLFSAARAQLVREVIRPALEKGMVVVCDRYVDSTTAYQGYGRGIPLSAIYSINSLAIEDTIPDVTFFFDISIETIELRQKAAGKINDRMEQAGREFFERVRRGFIQLAETEPRVYIINGERKKETITEEIWNILKDKLYNYTEISQSYLSGGRQ